MWIIPVLSLSFSEDLQHLFTEIKIQKVKLRGSIIEFQKKASCKKNVNKNTFTDELKLVEHKFDEQSSRIKRYNILC